jgi:Sec-independent protein translocase protein TatA
MATLMDFLGVGLFEVTLVIIVAVFAFGPTDLTRVAVQVARRIWRGGR